MVCDRNECHIANQQPNPNPNPAFKDPTITTTTSPGSYSGPKSSFSINLSFQNTLVSSPSSAKTPPAITGAAVKTTTYHIYPTPQNPCHALITQHLLPKSSSARRKLLKHNPDLLSTSTITLNAPSTSLSPSKSPSESYFLHLPTLTFHSPPRTLRRGATKTSPPICIIHNSPFWKRWRILTGPELLHAIDPRGLLPYEQRSAVTNRPRADDEVKGYRVRSWRACGESGKEYFRMVYDERKRRRKMVSDGDGDSDYDRGRRVWSPVRAEEVLPVTWMHATPFSTRVRWYSFVYEGVRATWKGSHDIPERKKWARRLMPAHHLKLVVEGGGGGGGSVSKKGEKHDHDNGQHQDQDRDRGVEKKDEDDGVGEKGEIILARYSSSLSHGKHGTLVIFDEEVRRVFGSQDLVRSRQDFACNREKEVGVVDEYDVIVATAMCMILGEWQKRKTVLEILLALAGAGADGGAAMA